MSSELAFLIRVAEGNLAAQSELFVESVRAWGGDFSDDGQHRVGRLGTSRRHLVVFTDAGEGAR